MPHGLAKEHFPKVLKCIAAWRVDPENPVECPVCGAPGLRITDRSARPYAEWYELACPACALAETINIPLPSPPAIGE